MSRSAALPRVVLVVSVFGGISSALPAPGPGPAAVPPPPPAQLTAPRSIAAVAGGLLPLERRPGPVPDYAPISAIWTHRQLIDTAPSMVAGLDAVLGHRHRVDSYTPLDPELAEEAQELVGGASTEIEIDNAMMWMRDYQPIFVRRPDGVLEAVRYLHPNVNRATYRLDDRADPWPEEARYRALPLVHEQGNMVVAGRWVFLSELIFADNNGTHAKPHLARAGYTARSPEQILTKLARAIHRPVSDIVVMPQMPGEATGHVDLWLMALDDHTVLIPRISAKLIRRANATIDRPLAESVRRFLEARARQLSALGLKVVRVPMLPPLVLPADDDDSLDSWDTVFYSPANGLLANTGRQRWALMPSIDLTALSPRLAPIQRQYERAWSSTLRAHGWTVKRLDATRLGRYLGLLRCVTQVVPRP